jgi:tRNA nucleotidyltransferase (CCA-adding enzyme)
MHSPAIARQLMSSPVRTIDPDMSLTVAQQMLLRYGHSAFPVVDGASLVGLITRRDLDIALHHGLGAARVGNHMSTALKTVTPETPLEEIEALMVTYDIGRLPVVEGDWLLGIVTRTDVLRYRHRQRVPVSLQPGLIQRLTTALQDLLAIAAQQAQAHGWQLYLVGGAVRDLRLGATTLEDIDLVVDGVADTAAGVALARSLQQTYSAARLQVHGQFQTAALSWHHDPEFGNLGLDIATARTEFYQHPAANPQVEASSIRQDLYRRDFTINALAIRLTEPNAGETLDFFGGLLDLEAKRIRVIHANSFIEDPTRIFRAVRFAVRLGFTIETQTERFIRNAIASGVYQRGTAKAPALQTRLKQELKYILQTRYWKPAVRRLADLGALSCIHGDLRLDDRLWWQLRSGDRWLRRFAPDEIHGSVLLEILLSALNREQRVQVAENLQLAADSVERLRAWDGANQPNLFEPPAEPPPKSPNFGLPAEPPPKSPNTGGLPEDRSPPVLGGGGASVTFSPSQIVRLLSPYDLPTLILFAVHQPRSGRRYIWQYLSRWRQVKPLLDGNDLKALGYPPGRQYKAMLDRLLSATLDGQVTNRTESERFLVQHFPK